MIKGINSGQNLEPAFV